MNLSDLPPTITVEEAGDLLGLSRSAAYRAATAGQLPTVRFGRRLKVPTPRLLRLLGADEETSVPPSPDAEERPAVQGRGVRKRNPPP